MKKKTFLVTGGSGFIGSNISKLLLDLNYKVVVYDNNFRNKNISYLRKKIIASLLLVILETKKNYLKQLIM